MSDTIQRIVVGDAFDKLALVPGDYADAVVTDPPYGLEFMGKEWDKLAVPKPGTLGGFATGDKPSFARVARHLPAMQEWHYRWAIEAHRILKSGAYLLAFGGTRTYHRLACAIEDAGFEIHDCLSWLYGSGFPKHKSKLKPAWEPVVMARKPAKKATLLNIDECRLGWVSAADEREAKEKNAHGDFGSEARGDTGIYGADHRERGNYDAAGRWPANVAVDEEAAEMVDEQTGDLGFSAGTEVTGNAHPHGIYGERIKRGIGPIGYGDSGGASRFFYCAKAARSEREAGCEHLTPKPGGSNAKGFTDDVANGNDRNRPVGNHHPTVKPIALMRWLVRLVTPVNGLVLDPFAGSGTTGVAAALEDRDFLGIERDEGYAAIARARIRHWRLTREREMAQAELFR